jgi:hypothetical protein
MPCSLGHAPQQMDALLAFVTVGKTAFTRLKNPFSAIKRSDGNVLAAK